MSIALKTRRSSSRGGLTLACVSLALLLCAVFSASASAGFGLANFDVQYSEQDATPGKPADDPPATQAGSHPFAVTTTVEMNYTGEFFEWVPDGGLLKEFLADLPDGLSGDATAMPYCNTTDFLRVKSEGSAPECPNNTAIGVAASNIGFPWPFFYYNSAVFNLEPPPGVPLRFGFNVLGVSAIFDVTVKPGSESHVFVRQDYITQLVQIYGAAVQLWGVPADPAHDTLRGDCIGVVSTSEGEVNYGSKPSGSCPANLPLRPLLNLPTSCTGPVSTAYQVSSWEEPNVRVGGSVLSHDDSEPPNPQGFTGCGKLNFTPSIEAQTTTDQAETGTGLDFDVDFNDEGLTNPNGLTESQTKKVEVTLPEGVTINPSIGEGLGVCTSADLDRETLESEPGEGCPNSSKIGTLHLETPLIDEDIEGSVYLAQQDDPTTPEPGAENPFDSLIALYLVLRNANLGVQVELPLKVEPDPLTGRLVATLEDIPQVPFSHFNFHFREGVRAALVSPAACGTYTTEAKFWPWSDPDTPRLLSSSFEVTKGVNGGPCPPGGVPPFHPGFEAGSLNNNAGSFSPFNMRLLRRDGEQNLTKFSSVLPPGVLGSLAGIEKCPDAAVAVAKAKTGRQEQADPSCPANSEIGRSSAGAGVGSALTYVPGKIYLAGPYKGAPLSVVSITPAVAGPFDAGTVAVRLGLDLNPVTAEVEVDGAASDPIPHILKGIVLKLRDLRVYVDRPNFTLNPTSCDESSAKARIFGSFVDVFSDADDRPVDRATRYQAANCLNLGFNPKLGLRLKGGTKRGNFPGLKAHYKPFAGHANIKDLVVRLPRSAFLEQGHIRTICTRVQFAADNCPKGARYGYIRAWTPLLDEPLQGPVWLRSSNHKLPDLVFDLQGLVDVEVQTRIDSVRGGIRARVENAPDAPISRVILDMQGGKKGLIVNSRNLCTKRKARANVKGTGQNGKQFTRKPVLRPQCGKRRKAKRSSHSRVSRVARASKAG